MSLCSSLCVIVLLIMAGGCGASLTFHGEDLYMSLEEVQEKVIGHTWTVLDSMPFESEDTQFPKYSNCREHFEIIATDLIKNRWAIWNEATYECFQDVRHYKVEQAEYVRLVNITEGQFGAEIVSEVTFISNDSDRFIFIVCCIGGWTNDTCVDAIIALSVKESMYDANKDGIIDDDVDPLREQMKSYARELFKPTRENPFERPWINGEKYCPLPPSD